MFQRRGLTATFGPRDKVMSVDFADITVLSCYSFFPSVYLVIGLPFDPLFATNTLAEDRFFQSLGIATIRATIVDTFPLVAQFAFFLWAQQSVP